MIARAPLGRLKLVAVLCALPLIIVLGRLVWLQGVRGDDIRRAADSQQMHRVYLPATRGEITDRNGDALAYTMYNHSIVAEPGKVTDPARTARTLASALDASASAIEGKLRSRRPEVTVWGRVTPLLDRRLDLESLPGISERLELKRVYPLGLSAAHVLGFVDAAGRGAGGIERECETLVRGTPGWATEMRDGRGESYRALGKRCKPAVPGHTVVLTLDATLQDVAASALRKKVEELDARGGALVAVDPRTGEILAMASWPSFDPERVGDAPEEARRNRAIVEPYEPGSTFKIVPAATALMDGLLSPATPIHCEDGQFHLAGRSFRDHHPYGILPMHSCFAVSSNIAFAKIGELCGPRLYDVARALGFGVRTGICLAGESNGLLRPPPRWSRPSAPTLAIGYEMMATPLQIAMAYAAVANDGVRMRPQLIKAVLDPDGRVVHQVRPQPVERVMEPAVARTIRSFMREVMTEGTGAGADLDWIEIGGKTGTSEKFVDGAYSRSKHYASFVGIAPLDDPRIVCLVMLDEPKGARFGGGAAAPVFREILESASRLGDTSFEPPFPCVSVRFASAPGRGILGTRRVEADPTVPATDAPFASDGMPDVRNRSLRDALLVLRAHGLEARVRGTGVVVRQTPGPGEEVRGPAVLTCSREGASALVGGPPGDDYRRAVAASSRGSAPGRR